MKLKLDMVYREIPPEDAQARFAALALAPDVAPLGPVGTRVLESVKKPPKPAKRKVVTALVPE